jgi:hypothetical protein
MTPRVDSHARDTASDEPAYARWRRSVTRLDLLLSYLPYFNRYRSLTAYPYRYYYRFDPIRIVTNWAVLVICYLLLSPYLRVLFADFSLSRSSAVSALATPTSVYAVSSLSHILTPMPMPAVTPAPTVTLTPTPTVTPAPTVTLTPMPAVTPTLAIAPRHSVQALYSYYYPALGGVNCAPSSWVNGQCTSLLLGHPWQDWLGRALALHPDLIPYFGAGACLRVTLPDGKQEYRVLADTCPACLDSRGIWVDLLDSHQRYNWGDPVLLEEVSPYLCDYP